MNSGTRFFTPDLKKLLITVCLCLIGVAGQIQAWAFSKVGNKPPLYDFLGSAPFWELWIFLLAPVALPLKAMGFEFSHLPEWLFIIFNVVYFYFLACIASGIIDLGRKRIKT